jgi:hypothetical protein|tara:strand:+ start:544 stop:660 length:117 start_codon:yes stop_codon:yes gene_type:complete
MKYTGGMTDETDSREEISDMGDVSRNLSTRTKDMSGME